MATSALGDIHGCFATLEALLSLCGYREGNDRLWLVGDLVNRGPTSLEVLRWAHRQGSQVTMVLGNHDLHLLAVVAGVRPNRKKDSFQAILTAPDRDELCSWLRERSFLHREEPYVMVHAGLLPAWTIPAAEAIARDLEAALRGAEGVELLRSMYERSPDRWDPADPERVRRQVAIKVFTRLRACREDGMINEHFTGIPADIPAGQKPWFDLESRQSREATIVFGHWAALGLHIADDAIGLDGGCGWGKELCAIRLEDRQVFRTPRLDPQE